MNEEIDIIELLKRVKEGKAPKEILVDGYKCEYNPVGDTIDTLYIGKDGMWFDYVYIGYDTKIKILDKPIIEKMNEDMSELNRFECNAYKKLNEIIDYINNKE